MERFYRLVCLNCGKKTDFIPAERTVSLPEGWVGIANALPMSGSPEVLKFAEALRFTIEGMACSNACSDSWLRKTLTVFISRIGK